MPVFELGCACGWAGESYLRRWDEANPPCPSCGAAVERLVSRFASPFSGSIHKYVDSNRENSHMDGFWGYKTKSSVSGNPEPVYLDSMQAVREFNKAEGLAAPGEVPTNCTISADGRRLISNGLPGQWTSGMPSIPSRLQEIIDAPAEKFKEAPATCTPCMPADYGVRVQAVDAPAEVGG